MKTLPSQMPPRYKYRFNNKLNEFEVKKRFRFTDANNKKIDTDTKWHTSIEECEKEAQEKIKDCSINNYEKLGKSTIKSVLNTLVMLSKADAKKKTKTKNTSSISYAKDLSSLHDNYTPDFIGGVLIKNIEPSDFSKWLTWINSDISGHKPLSGASVRKYRHALRLFNDYLGNNGYLDEQRIIYNSTAIDRVKVKSKDEGKREDRNFPKYDEFKTLVHHFRKGKEGDFNNFYWYTLFNVLFYTGMRVGELVGLKWQDIDFKAENNNGVIFINDAINEKETRENVDERHKANNRKTKNKGSKRQITIWKCYRELLSDYKNSYKYHYGLNEKELETCFVFPNITSKNDKLEYQNHKNMLRKLQGTIKKINKEITERNNKEDKDEPLLPKMDCQMFRHATAYLLAYEKGLSAEDTHDYFGHQDSDMINEVYAKLNAEEKMHKVNRKLIDIISEEPSDYVSNKNKSVLEQMKDGEELNKHIRKESNQRELEQIKRAISKGQEVYYYNPKYQRLIDDFKIKHPNLACKIKFEAEK